MSVTGFWIVAAAPSAAVSCGARSRSAALAMTFRLIESAQARWHAVNAARLVGPIRSCWEAAYLVSYSPAGLPEQIRFKGYSGDWSQVTYANRGH